MGLFSWKPFAVFGVTKSHEDAAAPVVEPISKPGIEDKAAVLARKKREMAENLEAKRERLKR
jgi:hypothetical protein